MLLKDEVEVTSSPVPASKSRNISTKLRTNLAALALLTMLRKGRVKTISSLSSLVRGGGLEGYYKEIVLF